MCDTKLSEIISFAQNAPVEKVIGLYIELFPTGSHLTGICPFHSDEHIGSFMVTPSKKMYKCYACGKGGDAIDFVSNYLNIGFKDACIKIAVDLGFITDADAKDLSSAKIDKAAIPQKKCEKQSKKEERIASKVVIHDVYTAMAAVCGLSAKHKKHLLHDRGLCESDLSDYFTFPSKGDNLIQRINGRLVKIFAKMYGVEYISDIFPYAERIQAMLDKISDELPYVPGFYKNKATGMIEFASYNGIGILSRNSEGHVVGIQIRRDTVKPNEQRYIWFSSSFALNDPNKEGGASSKAPAGVIYSKGKTTSSCLCITEGRFKAEAISKYIGDTVYVSGVSTWRAALCEIKATLKGRKKVLFAFDADILENTAIFDQLSSFSKALEEQGITCKVLLWPIECGKGFDDLIYKVGRDKYRSKLVKVDFSLFQKQYQKILEEVLKNFRAESIAEIEKEKFKTVLKEAQESYWFADLRKKESP